MAASRCAEGASPLQWWRTMLQLQLLRPPVTIRFPIEYYHEVSSRSSCYHSGNQKFCILKSRLLTGALLTCNSFFRNKTFLFCQDRKLQMMLIHQIPKIQSPVFLSDTYTGGPPLTQFELPRIPLPQSYLENEGTKLVILLTCNNHFQFFCGVS